MKYFFLLFCLTLFFSSKGQTDFEKLKKYHNQFHPAAGLRIGELTGVSFELFRGMVCGGHKERLQKRFAIQFTIGESRLFSKEGNFNYKGGGIEKGGLRGELDLINRLISIEGFDFYFLGGLQYGQRSYKYTNYSDRFNSIGINTSLGVEYNLGATRSRNAPFYFTTFLESGPYFEISANHFTDIFISAGLKIYSWK